MILESYAEVYSNQFTTRNSQIQLLQCRTILKKYKYVNEHMIPFPKNIITRNTSRASQPLSRVNVTGILRRLQVKILKT